MKHRFPVILVALLLLASILGCSAESSDDQQRSSITVGVVVTKSFGQELILEETIQVPAGASAMEALQQVADVDTAYGGGFVNAINGIRSKRSAREDWLFYINGIAANRGAAAYRLSDGDIQHWDFRDWSFRFFIPAIIGDFPGSFLHGYRGQVRPTVIAYADGLSQDAEALKDRLIGLGVENVFTQDTSALTENDKQHSNLILLGTKDSALVSELNRIWDRMGFFVRFDDDVMVVHDAEGEASARYGAASGVIQATQSPWNPKGIGASENVVWMVSGTDEAGVRSAVDALINRHDEFRYAFAIVVANGEIIKVPR